MNLAPQVHQTFSQMRVAVWLSSGHFGLLSAVSQRWKSHSSHLKRTVEAGETAGIVTSGACAPY
jgi:hypothetical protein